MTTDPKQTTDEPQEKVYLDYIPVDVVQRILSYPQRRAAKIAEIEAQRAAEAQEAAAKAATAVETPPTD
jgi:hypothetical protein